MTAALPELPGARVAPESFATGARVPRHAVRPADRIELCELMRVCARDGLTVVPWGGGASLERSDGTRRPADPLERYDVAIDLRGLDRIVEYEPEDLTLTAECGVSIASLRARLADRGQELPLEAPHASRATLGGVLAANASGARRLRFGGPRDRILGARFVLGDGTLAHTGGKVVKNVAGYGIHRLLCGSRGGLAILVDASLKLAPAPERRIAMVYALDRAAISDAARWASLPRDEPAVLTVVRGECATALPGRGSAEWWCVIGFEEDAVRADQLRDRTRERLGSPAIELRDRDAEALWQSLADTEDAIGGAIFASAHRLPAALPALEGATDLVFHAACGRLAIAIDPGHETAAANALADAGFVASPSRDPGDRPQAIRTLRATIRAALDPGRRFALGGNWEWGTG